MSLQAASPPNPMATPTPHLSPWHTPVPYLFGGLAAMLSLIAFALLILACSFSKNTESDDHGGDIEAGSDTKPNNHNIELAPVFQDKYLVIMAGEAKPTFLATPVSSRASSFGSCSCRSNSTEKSSSESEENDKDKDKEKQLQERSRENQETTNQIP